MMPEKKISPFVSVVFPNFNGGNFVIKVIDSILSLNYPTERFEIIIIDNGSSDNSPETIKSRCASYIDSKKIKLIELDSNVGAPAAYNIGIKNADENYDYILKLDNDLILDKNSLAELIKSGESDVKIGIVGGKVFYFSEKERLHLIGSKLRPFYGGGIGIGKYKLDRNKYNKNLELDAVNGCMMLVKSSLINEIGLMDEKYFLYFDDLDWSLRAVRKGFKSIYCHNATAFHNTSPPYKRFQSRNWLHYAVYNSFYFMRKNYTGLDRLIFLIATHLRVLHYIVGIFLNNNIFKQIYLLKTVFSSYSKGMAYLWIKES